MLMLEGYLALGFQTHAKKTDVDVEYLWMCSKSARALLLPSRWGKIILKYFLNKFQSEPEFSKS